MKIAFDNETRTFSVLGRSIWEVDIDFTNISSEDDVHDLLQSKLGLGPGYGRNMDALYDILTAVSCDMRIVLSHWRHKGMHVRKAVEVMMAAKQVNGHLDVWTAN